MFDDRTPNSIAIFGGCTPLYLGSQQGETVETLVYFVCILKSLNNSMDWAALQWVASRSAICSPYPVVPRLLTPRSINFYRPLLSNSAAVQIYVHIVTLAGEYFKLTDILQDSDTDSV